METAARPSWISTREAAELAELPVDQVRKLVRRRAITVRKLPGLRALINRSEFETLVKDSVRPAMA